MTKENEKYLIDGEKGKWEVVIGLEVHAQVTSNSKLFSGSSTKFGAEPNTQVSLVDSAFPGMLPVINEYCIQQAVKTGLGLNASSTMNDKKTYKKLEIDRGRNRLYRILIAQPIAEIHCLVAQWRARPKKKLEDTSPLSLHSTGWLEKIMHIAAISHENAIIPWGLTYLAQQL